MPNMLIRNVEDGLKIKIRIRAAEHGRSMEEEVREILRAALATDRRPPRNLGKAIQARFAAVGGLELPEIPRGATPAPLGLGE